MRRNSQPSKSTNGVISGVPNLAGDSQVSLTASNSLGLGASVVLIQIFDTGSSVVREVWDGVTGANVSDLHTGQTAIVKGTPVTTLGSHANLFAELSQCLYVFQRGMEQLNLLYPGLSNSVTTFTSNDFGRTYPSNGQGSDHGWGSHHLIMGGAVQGQKTYGKFPTLAINGPDDTDTGRWIPTTACDQYLATLASWFGVDNSNLSTVFPNLGFATPNLGFV